MSRSVAQLKHKLRQLKKLEVTIRFGHRPAIEPRQLIWDTFFSTRDAHDASVKYSLCHLLKLETQEMKDIFAEYFYRIYFQYFKEHGMTAVDAYDPMLLSLLGLPPYVGIEDIKRRYRELARKYHPDHGGDSAKFIEVADIYEELKGE